MNTGATAAPPEARWLSALTATAVASLFAGCVAPTRAPSPIEPPPVYFRQDWCPTESEVTALSHHLQLVRSGCCVYKGNPLSRFGFTAGALTAFTDRIIAEGDPFARCLGVDPAEVEQQRADAAAAAEREAAARATALERERTRPAREAAAALETAAMRRAQLAVMTDLDLCALLGDAARDPDATPPEWQSEAKRRHLSIHIEMARHKQIRIGSPECQVYASWGAPESRNRTLTRSGERAQLVYGIGHYVYTEAGLVTAIQD